VEDVQTRPSTGVCQPGPSAQDSKAQVERFYCVGRVDNLAYLLWKLVPDLLAASEILGSRLER
jgi:hypothetical protein